MIIDIPKGKKPKINLLSDTQIELLFLDAGGTDSTKEKDEPEKLNHEQSLYKKEPEIDPQTGQVLTKPTESFHEKRVKSLLENLSKI